MHISEEQLGTFVGQNLIRSYKQVLNFSHTHALIMYSQMHLLQTIINANMHGVRASCYTVQKKYESNQTSELFATALCSDSEDLLVKRLGES